MPKPKRAKGTLTIYDVADRAGVSIASPPRRKTTPTAPFEEEYERLLFIDVINRGIEAAAQHRLPEAK